MTGTKSLDNISSKLQRIAELARRYPNSALTTLAHHVDVDMMREAYRLTRKNAAPGVDGETAEQFAANLESNLQSLVDRLHTGSYRAPAVKRVHIDKGNGQTRPIGIPTFEDKVMQRAVTMVLTAVYEQDFLDCSHGFRPNRSPHTCLATLRRKLMTTMDGWVVELDIKDCFGSFDHAQLRGFLDKRVRDGVLRKAIHKWMKAGVLEEGSLSYPRQGTPQGGVISPLLANIYLHEVLDVWFENTVKPLLSDNAHLLRFADDAVLVFRNERDARKVFDVLPKRFGKYGLTLHPSKTRLIQFQRPSRKELTRERERSGSFDFLGFTHLWSRAKSGSWVVKRSTASDRLRKALARANEWCRENRHWPVKLQHKMLAAKLRGHYGYYGVVSNGRALKAYFQGVCRIWRTWLNRRDQRHRMPWTRFYRLLLRYALPQPVVVHSGFGKLALSHAAKL